MKRITKQQEFDELSKLCCSYLQANSYCIVIDDGGEWVLWRNCTSITVNGYSTKIKIKSGHTYNLLKTYIGVSQIEDFAYFIQDESWKHSGCPAAICKHVITYGKYCA